MWNKQDFIEFLNGSYANKFERYDYLQVQYRRSTGDVDMQAFGNHEVPFKYSSLSALSYQDVFDNIDEVKHPLYLKDAKHPIDLVSVKFMSRFHPKEDKYASEKEKTRILQSPFFVFGHPFYADAIEDKILVEYETFFDDLKSKRKISLSDYFDTNMIDIKTRKKLVKTIDNFEHPTSSNRPYTQFLKLKKEIGSESIFVKTRPVNEDSWDVDKLGIHAVDRQRNLKFIHPNDHTKIWESGEWVDVQWQDKAIIDKCGNCQKIPRLK